MQVHHEPGALPVLAQAGKIRNKKRMQTHAPNACPTKTGKMMEKKRKKPAFRVPVWDEF